MSETRAAAQERLPRGRHHLSAESVASSQRRRLIEAVVRVIGERGWSETRIADVVAAAGVSRRTFYEQFDSLEACFAAAVEAGFARLLAAIDDRTLAADLDFEARVRRFFKSYLGLLATTPGATRALHVEMVRATDGIRALHDRIIEEVGERLLVARFGDGERTVPDDFGAALVGGFEHLLSRRIRAGHDAARLAEAVDDATAIAMRALG